jgi:hypothetical protein
VREVLLRVEELVFLSAPDQNDQALSATAEK